MALGNDNQQHFQRQQQSAAATQQIQMQPTRAIYSVQHQRPIAPAPSHSYAPYTKPTLPTTIQSCVGTTLDSNNPSVVRRNARERNRVKQVNNGFVHLRQHIPQAIVADLSNGRRGIGPGASKKLSKVDTLKMALEYIRRLQRVIEDVDSSSSCSDTSSVSSYNGSNSSSSSSMSGSPPPQMHAGNSGYYQSQTMQQPHLQQQHFYPISYAGSFPMQQQQYQPSTMISPAASSASSSAYSTDSYYQQSSPTLVGNSIQASATPTAAPVQVKFEQSFEDFSDDSPSAEDDELLDYISLWQEEM